MSIHIERSMDIDLSTHMEHMSVVTNADVNANTKADINIHAIGVDTDRQHEYSYESVIKQTLQIHV